MAQRKYVPQVDIRRILRDFKIHPNSSWILIEIYDSEGSVSTTFLCFIRICLLQHLLLDNVLRIYINLFQISRKPSICSRKFVMVGNLLFYDHMTLTCFVLLYQMAQVNKWQILNPCCDNTGILSRAINWISYMTSWYISAFLIDVPVGVVCHSS